MISSALVTFSIDLLVLLLILLLTSIKISVDSASSSDDKNESASLGLHIVVLTQNFPYEFERANKLHNDLWNQVESENKNKIELALFHGLSREFDGAKIPKDTKSQENGNLLLQGFWAIWPILKRLDIRLRTAKWTLFLSPYTRLTHGVQPLIEHFLHYNHSEARFIGTAFFDESPVIIHHYHNGFITGLDGKQKSFLYPDIFSSAGFALSNGLLQQLLVHLEEGGKSGGSEKESKKRRRRIGPNFAIDPGFELAQLIFESSDATLENDPIFCFASQKQEKDESKCLLEFEAPDYLECDEAGAVLANSKKESIARNGQLAYYAVKTHVGNHQTRVPVIQNTWANLLAADHQIGYFSDAEAINIPTIDLGVQNTERGHCGKTFAILRYFLGNPATEYFRWLVLADDDTLFSVPRLQHFLRCLPQDQPVIAGQRYGYGFSVDGTDGYDYPTGGAGIVFSRSAVEMLTQNCVCPSLDSPDDMIIGLCARRLDIPIIHSAAFHQARPIDYSKEVIQRIWAGKHISFHKFEELDPLEVFQELLQENPQKHAKNEEWKAHEEF